MKWSGYGLSLNRFKSSVKAKNFELALELVWPSPVRRSYDTSKIGYCFVAQPIVATISLCHVVGMFVFSGILYE